MPKRPGRPKKGEKKLGKPKQNHVKPNKPPKYNKELSDYICARVATSTHGLRRLCAEDDQLPSATTIDYWRYIYPEFEEAYDKAKVRQAKLLAEQTLELADESRDDPDAINAIKLQIDTRRWLAGKLQPRKFGERTTVETVDESSEELKDKLLKLEQELKEKYEKEY